MPVYVIEFVTSDARPQQRRFTLDDDRPLRAQVEHVLAELERAGLVLRGGPADELAVRWAGQEVDSARSPAALGITPDRPVELRMQRRRAPVVVAPPPPPPEAPATRFVPRSVYAGAALGAAGGWAAWTVAGALADAAENGGAPASPAELDAVLAGLFGLLVGAAVGAGSAHRSRGSTVGGAAAGGAAGLVAAAVAAVLIAAATGGGEVGEAVAATPGSAILLRAGAWALAAALTAGAAALVTARWGAGAGRVGGALRAAGAAALTGFAAGLVPALPGPVELWSALAAALAGAGVGAGVTWAAFRRAAGVLSLEAIGARGPGVLSLREWALGEGRAAALGDAAADPTVAVANGVVTQVAAADAAPRPVRQDDRVVVGTARYRFRRLAGAALALALVGPWGGRRARVAGAQSPAGSASTGAPAGGPALPIDGVALVRCLADRPTPCIDVRVTLPPAAAAREAFGAGVGELGGADADSAGGTARDAARAAGGWSGRLGPYALQPVRVRAVRAGGPRRVVLTLVDVSGSMAGDGMQVARAAVRSFLRDLGAGARPGDVQAALGAFASRNVAAAVQRVAFADPATAAAGVDLLPAPAGNTALYSAVALGAERAAAAARVAGEGTRAALVVLTDGVNDVTDAAGRPRRDDDPGLLRGPEGRSAAAATAHRLGVDLYLVGVGQAPDMSELGALAGDQGRAFRTARDAVALREALARVDAALAPTRDVLFAVPGAERATLARPEWRLVVAQSAPGARGADGRGAPAAEFAGMWPAPLVGTPVFAGAAFRGDGRGPAAPQWLRATAGDAPTFGRRAVVSLFVALLVAIVWALPRAIWQPAPWPAAAATGGGAGTAAPVTDAPLRQLPLRPAGAELAAGGAASAGGLVPDVREAPPRRPEDVTAQRARRGGTRPASRIIAAPAAAPRRL